MIHERFYKAISQRRRILLIFKAKTTLEVIPVEIVDIKDRKFFKIIDENGNEQVISVEKISGLTQNVANVFGNANTWKDGVFKSMCTNRDKKYYSFRK